VVYWGVALCIVGYLLVLFGKRASIQRPRITTFGASLVMMGAAAVMLGGVFWAFG
jgi:hypothetical membrane protein